MYRWSHFIRIWKIWIPDSFEVMRKSHSCRPHMRSSACFVLEFAELEGFLFGISFLNQVGGTCRETALSQRKCRMDTGGVGSKDQGGSGVRGWRRSPLMMTTVITTRSRPRQANQLSVSHVFRLETQTDSAYIWPCLLCGAKRKEKLMAECRILTRTHTSPRTNPRSLAYSGAGWKNARACTIKAHPHRRRKTNCHAFQFGNWTDSYSWLVWMALRRWLGRVAPVWWRHRLWRTDTLPAHARPPARRFALTLGQLTSA